MRVVNLSMIIILSFKGEVKKKRFGLFLRKILCWLHKSRKKNCDYALIRHQIPLLLRISIFSRGLIPSNKESNFPNVF